MTSQLERAEQFRALHQRPGIFVMPNRWDAASAKLFASLGFEALAMRAGSFAWVAQTMPGKNLKVIFKEQG